MDWQGQKLEEQLIVVACTTSYILGSFQMMVLIYADGMVLTTLITIPNWPFFNRHPLKLLDPSEAKKHPKPQQAINLKRKLAKK
ncbi:hypothetical protein SLA2020_117780 [Shorea laevis]